MWCGRRLSPRDVRMAMASTGRYKVWRQCRASDRTRDKCLNALIYLQLNMIDIA